MKKGKGRAGQGREGKGKAMTLTKAARSDKNVQPSRRNLGDNNIRDNGSHTIGTGYYSKCFLYINVVHPHNNFIIHIL